MKKLLAIILSLGLLVSITACSSESTTNIKETPNSSESTDVSNNVFEGNIAVYTRDTSSGTRSGFMGKIGFKDAETDDSVLVEGFIIQGNSEIIAAVQQDVYAIGYVSLSTLDSNLFKGLSFEGVEPTISNVLDESYLLARKFNYMLRDDYSVYGTDAARIEEISKAFVAYMGSLEGKATIMNAGGIVDLTTGSSWDDIKANYPVCTEDNSDLTIKFGGSDSVEKIAKALSPDFAAKCGNFTPEHNHTGSSNAWKGLNGGNASIDDGLSIMIGFASREFKESEVANITGVVATDAIVAIVNLDNPVENMTAQELKDIYSGVITNWSDFE